MAEELPGTDVAADTAAGAAFPVAGQPLLRIEGVTKTFGTFRAVDGVSLDIKAGEFFALLGPSGCGKTTLLRMLAGFEAPDEGRILLGGKDIAQALPHERPINMMFQNYALFPHLSVRDNIAFGLKRAGLARADIATRVAEMLALVKLEGLEKRKPDQLSGGQRQRVALARALARRPQLLLLDEPLAALDKKLRESTQGELMELQRRLGMTFIIVTHDQEEAMTMASQIGVMKAGKLAQVASPASSTRRRVRAGSRSSSATSICSTPSPDCATAIVWSSARVMRGRWWWPSRASRSARENCRSRSVPRRSSCRAAAR